MTDAAILIIGNEILSGRTEDANVAHIARRLADVGVAVREVRVVPDIENEIVDALNALRARYGYVFTTGGIGPTHDDITIVSVAKAFGVAVARNTRVEEHLRTTYGNRATEATLRMADYPEGAALVWHEGDWAPACRMENVFVLAGIPRAMQVMLAACVPLLGQGAPIHSKTLDVWARESDIADGLAAVQGDYPQLEVGSYPYRIDNRPGTALVVRGADAVAVEAAHKAICAMVEALGVEKRAA
ncbi:MAG: competence/damage-inducible protein A [Pseudomonadaceae bacterium]|nr:competence/damage-inducible protein A [Pseudomonadaceae bacterium]